ncbi:MAG: DUF3488 domain-containing protein [Phycisphaeraceae bacterium]|nr:DUF3488 domain-containing protein [Phycisphaeraceae bacterium]
MSRRRLPRLVITLVLLGFALYAIAEGEMIVLAVAIPLAIVGWWRSERAKARAMPRAVLGALVLAAIANAIRGISVDRLDVTDFCEFVILIQLIKVFDRKSPRDYAQLITLSTFLAIGSVLTSVDFVPGLLLLVFIVLLVIAAVQYQIFAGHRAVQDWRARIAPADAPVPEIMPPKGRRTTLAIATVVVLSIASGVGVSAAVFVLVPRGLGGNALGQWAAARAGAVTGFSDSVRLGGSGVISESQQVVLDLELRDAQGNALGGPNEVFYLRGAVLDDYQDRIWRADRSHRSAARLPVEPDEPYRVGGPRPGDPNLIQTITLRHASAERTYLFAIWQPTTISFSSPCELVQQTADLTMTRLGAAGKIRYRVESVPNPIQPERLGSAERTPASFPSQRIEQLAADVLRRVNVDPDPAIRDIDSDALAARSIENHLRSDYTYTLRMASPPIDQDPIEWFLFRRRQGHCEYFASAMVAMCRSVGINARMVTGYVAAEWNESSMHYIVRESNAHAWVEVEVKPGVWRTYDPTPPGDLRDFHLPRNSIMARIERAFEALEYLWINSVVGFDERTRLRLLGRSAPDARRGSTEFDALTNLRERVTPGRIRDGVLNGIAVFVATAAAGLLLVGLTRRFSPRPGRRSAAQVLSEIPTECRDQAQFYEELLRVLRRVGHQKPESKPPLAHALSLAASMPRVAVPAIRLSRAFYQLRFDRRPLDESQRAAVEADMRRLREAADAVSSENRAHRS